MSHLDASLDRYPDVKIDHAIHEAICACNRRVSTADVLGNIFGRLYGSQPFKDLSRTEKQVLKDRITRKMSQYEMESGGHKSKTWIVKE
jgi:hypothetical protein